MQHHTPRRSRPALAALAVGALALAAAAPAALATPATAAPGNPLIDDAQSVTHTPQGAVQSLSFGQKGATATAQDLGKAYGADAGSTFASVRAEKLGNGQLTRYQQVIDGHVVAGSSLASATDANGHITQSMGNVATSTTGAFPAARSVISANRAAAVEAALKATSAGSRAQAAVKAEVWFAPAVAGTTTSAGTDTSATTGTQAQGTVAQPAYQVSVTSTSGGWLVTVNANQPSQVLAKATTHFEINRVVCDANRYKAVYTSDLKCGTGLKNKPSRVEGGAASSVADVNSVYTFFGDTSSFYANKTTASDLTTLVGVNYNDGLGKAIRGSVRQCISGDSCPYLNAFWSDDLSAMVYGEGVTTDDVTGHELTHGVTSKTSGLAYENEAGAINESLSDIFGELMDQGNGSADDTAANKWKMGEGSSLGVIRDMKSPKTYQQPDTYKGTYWVATTSNPTDSNDYGGVHTNSGVGNKLASLLSDGGTHNAVAVTGVGTAKTAQIFWGAQSLLTSNATYSTLGTALKQSCSSNASSGVKGITTADCTQVANAIKAVKIP